MTAPVATEPGVFVLAVNVSGVDSCLAQGSLAYVEMQNGSDGVTTWVYGRTRGGRWVRKAVPSTRLSNPRVKFLPSRHPAAAVVWREQTREAAEASRYLRRWIDLIVSPLASRKGGAQ